MKRTGSPKFIIGIPHMDTASIFQALNGINPITEDAWVEFEQLLEPVELKRNEFLVREGSRTSSCYMLLEGVVRVFYNKDGNEYNKTFFIPGMFPTPLTALLSDSPSALSFQALLPCRIVGFSYKEFRALFGKHRCLESMMLRILELEWISKERHEIRMVTNDATTNYLIFRKEYPDLENLIPQYHIASYLGITPIQLSRIRSQLVHS
jgi:CRP-like cAMP-binding protein